MFCGDITAGKQVSTSVTILSTVAIAPSPTALRINHKQS